MTCRTTKTGRDLLTGEKACFCRPGNQIGSGSGLTFDLECVVRVGVMCLREFTCLYSSHQSSHS